MPIFSLEGPDAVRVRKANEYATWGSRNTENRVEPIASPAFDVPFRLQPGETIFTIGSCFARNVEGELIQRGFRIPMRELFKRPEFKDLPPEIVNNFGTPSIYNEFAWAFGAQTYDEGTNILEVGTDKYVDLHMVNSIRPAPLETVLQRRRGLIDATRIMAECRVMIMTLGLVELWWDNETQSYLNTGPLPSILKTHPKRFALHVLSFAECHDYLRRALDIAFENARDDLSVILTVSPVPMMATHRNTDVITANTYSKSVLRAVAEQLVAEDRRITYFPSYETVSLSDRGFTWTDDFVHVNRDMIALNVERMVNAFTGEKTTSNTILPDTHIGASESADALLLAERAREARIAGDTAFFEQYGQAAESSPAFALEHAKFLYETQLYDEVMEITARDERPGMLTLRAKTLIAAGEPKAACKVVRPLCLKGLKDIEPWRTYVAATVALQSETALLKAEEEWLEAQPRNRGLIQAVVGRALREIGENEKAAVRLSAASAQPDRNPGTVIEYAACLVDLGRHAEAGQALDGVRGNTDWQTKRIRRLRNRVQRAATAEHAAKR